MNKEFDQFLAMLESKASTPERKADLHAARELYHKGVMTEGWTTISDIGKWGLSKLGNVFGGKGKTSADYKGAEKAPEIKERDDAKAARIREVDENLSKASKLVIDAAEWNPGQVDAWVDYRLKPAIEKSLKSEGGFLTPEEKKEAFDEERAKFEKIYKNADKSDKKAWEDNMSAALKKADEDEAYRKEEEQFKAAEEQDKKDREMAAASQEKRDALDSKAEGHTAQDPVNGTDLDSNMRAATARSEEFNKREEDRKKTDFAGDDGSTLNVDDIDVSKFGGDMFGESVSTKKLRAAFESVYGDSRGYTDKEIRVICESCYRRRKK